MWRKEIFHSRPTAKLFLTVSTYRSTIPLRLFFIILSLKTITDERDIFQRVIYDVEMFWLPENTSDILTNKALATYWSWTNFTENFRDFIDEIPNDWKIVKF